MAAVHRLPFRDLGAHPTMAAMAPRKDRQEQPRVELDQTTIRYLLTLTPEERIRLAAEEARNLRLFDLEVEKSKDR